MIRFTLLKDNLDIPQNRKKLIRGNYYNSTGKKLRHLGTMKQDWKDPLGVESIKPGEQIGYGMKGRELLKAKGLIK